MRTAKELMTTSVPKAQPDETAGFALERLREQKPEEASHLYLVDEASVLIGQVPIERLIAAAPETTLGDLRGDPPIEVRPDDDAETVALLAVERHDADVAVVDDKRGSSAQSRLAGCSGFCTRSTLTKSCAEQAWARGIRRRLKRTKRSGRSGRECPGSRLDCWAECWRAESQAFSRSR